MADFAWLKYLNRIQKVNFQCGKFCLFAMHFLRLQLEEQGFLGLSYSKLTLLGQGIRYLTNSDNLSPVGPLLVINFLYFHLPLKTTCEFRTWGSAAQFFLHPWDLSKAAPSLERDVSHFLVNELRHAVSWAPSTLPANPAHPRWKASEISPGGKDRQRSFETK